MIPLISAEPAAIVQSAPASPSPVIMVKTTGDALFIWNASDAILDIVKRGTPNDQALKEIELRGARILSDKCAQLESAATCSLRVIYPHDPQFNSTYQVEVVSSMEKLMLLTAQRQRLVGDKQIDKALDAGNIPKAITVTLTGKLPAQSS